MAIVLPKFPRRRASNAREINDRPTLSMRCCRADGRYAPGETLECTWRVERVTAEILQGIEVSVLWYTEGKGDEDLAVHFFHRWSTARLQTMDLSVSQRFATRLPASPFSYDGVLFRIRWCARMRLFRSVGRDIVTEQPFIVQPLSVPAPIAPPFTSSFAEPIFQPSSVSAG